MERRIITMIPITKGQWATPQGSDHGHINDWDKDPKGAGMYFMELVFDWSILPQESQGKIYVEMMGDRKLTEVDIEIRLAYQLKAAEWYPVRGSEIRHKGSAQWQLLESEWFDLPTVPGVSCLWIQGQAHDGGVCQVALVTLVIAEVTKRTPIEDAIKEKIATVAKDIKETQEPEIVKTITSAKVDEWTGLHVD